MKATRAQALALVGMLVVLLGGFALQATGQERRQTWEYHIVYGVVTAAALEKAGREGWELVGFQQVPRTYAGSADPDLNGRYRVEIRATDVPSAVVFKRRATP